MKLYTIQNPHKLEVKEKRIPLTYFVSIPDKIDKNTIPIVVLHGFGDYASSKYMLSLHKTLSRYNLAIITINYVGTFTKVTLNKKDLSYPFLEQYFQIEDKKDFLKFLKAILTNPVEMNKILKQNNFINNNIDINNYLLDIKELFYNIQNNSYNGMYVLKTLENIGFNSSFSDFISDTKGDHQDFGLIQAIDVLTVIADLKQNKEYQNINWSKLSIVGSSHGGYIASMCDKLAPNTFSTIVNNSGWIKPYIDFPYIETSGSYARLKAKTKDNNYWSKNINDKNFLSLRHYEIRDLSNIKHLKTHSKIKNNIKSCKYIFIHTSEDHLIPINEKDNYIKQLEEKGYDITYLRLSNVSQLDGKTFKNLGHGANASIKGLVIDYIIKNRDNLNKIVKSDFDLHSKIKYNCNNGKYIINYNNKYPKVRFKIYN